MGGGRPAPLPLLERAVVDLAAAGLHRLHLGQHRLVLLGVGGVVQVAAELLDLLVELLRLALVVGDAGREVLLTGGELVDPLVEEGQLALLLGQVPLGRVEPGPEAPDVRVHAVQLQQAVHQRHAAGSSLGAIEDRL